MSKKSVFRQALEKGSMFSFVFFLFFMMSTLPLILLFVISLAKKNLPGIALSLVFRAILARDIKVKNLYGMCRDMAVLNLTLWFLLGFFSLIIGFLGSAQGVFGYVFLLPYAMISGYFVFYLLKKSSKHPWDVLMGAVTVSTMMAVVSAINGAIMSALTLLSERLAELESEVGVSIISRFSMGSFNQHIAFIGILIFFNLPFILYYYNNAKQIKLWKNFKKKGDEVVNANLSVVDKAFKLAAESYADKFRYKLSDVEAPERMVMNGNQAIGMGALLAGVKFISAYPMTPSTSSRIR